VEIFCKMAAIFDVQLIVSMSSRKFAFVSVDNLSVDWDSSTDTV